MKRKQLVLFFLCLYLIMNASVCFASRSVLDAEGNLKHDTPKQSEAISDRIPQEGGYMEHIDIQIVEYTYVGNLLRLVYHSEPKVDNLKLLSPFLEFDILSGPLMSFSFLADSFPHGISMLGSDEISTENGMITCDSFLLDDQAPDTLELSFIGMLWDEEIDQFVEESEPLTFEIQRTAEAEKYSYSTNQAVGEYTITQIDIHQLPADIYVKLTYAPTIANSTDQCLSFDYHDDSFATTDQGGYCWFISESHAESVILFPSTGILPNEIRLDFSDYQQSMVINTIDGSITMLDM